MTKRIIALLTACCLALALTACGGDATDGGGDAAGSGSGAGGDDGMFRVAYLNRDDTNEFLNTTCGMVQALCEADGSIEFTRYDAQADANNQLTQFEDALSKGVDLMIVVPQDKETVVSKVIECNGLGIPVIALDIGLEEGSCDFVYIGSDNYTLAYTQGRYLMDNLVENGRFIYLHFTPGSEIAADRDDGTADALAESGRTDYEIIATMEFDATTEKATSLMEDLLQVHGDDWDAILIHSANGTYGVIAAMEGAGIDPSEKMIVSFDGEEMERQMILEGRITASIMQNQVGMSDKAYEVIKIYQEGGEPDSGVYYLEGVLLDIDNVQDYM